MYVVLFFPAGALYERETDKTVTWYAVECFSLCCIKTVNMQMIGKVYSQTTATMEQEPKKGPILC